MGHWENRTLENLSHVHEGILYIEEWKPISGYEGLYEISSFGRVKSLNRYHQRTEFIVKLQLSNKGYCRIALYKDAKGKKYQIHRLVANHFIQNPENKPEPNHKKGIKTDNMFKNLEWVTKSENLKHATSTGLKTQFGEKNPIAKLNKDKILQIRALLKEGKSLTTIGNLYGVKFQTISDIKRGKIWSHI